MKTVVVEIHYIYTIFLILVCLFVFHFDWRCARILQPSTSVLLTCYMTVSSKTYKHWNYVLHSGYIWVFILVFLCLFLFSFVDVRLFLKQHFIAKLSLYREIEK